MAAHARAQAQTYRCGGSPGNAAASSGSQAARPLREDATPWDRVNSALWGKFVLDPVTNSVGLHCHLHGPGCRINKVLRKRPIGYFAAWALAGQSVPLGPEGRQAHMAMRFLREAGTPMDFEHRSAARNRALDEGSIARVFEWERAEGNGAIGDHFEPEHVA